MALCYLLDTTDDEDFLKENVTEMILIFLCFNPPPPSIARSRFYSTREKRLLASSGESIPCSHTYGTGTIHYLL